MGSMNILEIPSGISTAPSRTSYLQLMVTAQKVESENEEIQDKVRAMAAVPTYSGRKPQN